MALSEDMEILIEKRRSEEVAVFMELKMQGVPFERIMNYLALKQHVCYATVVRDLKIRGVIGKKTMMKIEKLTGVRYRTKQRNRNRHKRERK